MEFSQRSLEWKWNNLPGNALGPKKRQSGVKTEVLSLVGTSFCEQLTQGLTGCVRSCISISPCCGRRQDLLTVYGKYLNCDHNVGCSTPDQNNTILHPTPTPNIEHDILEISVRKGTRSELIRGWACLYHERPGWVPRWVSETCRLSKPPVSIIIFHEPRQCYTALGPLVRLLHSGLKANVFIFTYRGYCKDSTFEPTEASTHEDAKIAFKHIYDVILKPTIKDPEIYVFGRGYGCAAAARVAKDNKDKVKGVICENPYPSHRAVKCLKWAKSPLASKIFLDAMSELDLNPLADLQEAGLPCLILEGIKDTTESPALMPQWGGALKKLVHYKKLDARHGCAHSDDPKELIKAIKTFFVNISARKRRL